MASAPLPATAAGDERETDLVCHCRRVPYGRVRAAIRDGEAATLADVQRTTTACTRCFGCRFELERERMLSEELGERYTRTAFVTRPEDDAGPLRRRILRLLGREAAPPAPKRTYMPVLHGLRGDVRTRIALYHWAAPDSPAGPIDVRADLLDLDGRRLDVWHTAVAPGAATSSATTPAAIDGAFSILDRAVWLPTYGWWPSARGYALTVLLTPYHAAVEDDARFSFTLRGFSGSHDALFEHEVGELGLGDQRGIELSSLDLPEPPPSGGILEVQGVRLDKEPRNGVGFVGMWLDGQSPEGGGYIIPTIPIRARPRRSSGTISKSSLESWPPPRPTPSWSC